MFLVIQKLHRRLRTKIGDPMFSLQRAVEMNLLWRSQKLVFHLKGYSRGRFSKY
jgi:hypothetical protein